MRTPVSMERRKHRRYLLGVPAKFFWKDARDAQHEGIGITRDISVRGLFVFAKTSPPPESEVELKAFLPPGRSALLPLLLHGRGRVVRVGAAHDGERRAGFALAGKPLVLRRGGEY